MTTADRSLIGADPDSVSPQSFPGAVSGSAPAPDSVSDSFSGVRRVLIYRLGSLGDTMVVLPSLHIVARRFPQAERLLLSNQPVHGKAPAASAILDNSGLITGYMSYPVGTRNPLTLASVALRIRKYRPDLLVYLTKPRGERVLERDRRFFRYACGVPKIVGLPVGDLGENLAPATPGGLYESEAARLLRSLRSLQVLDGPSVSDLREAAGWDLRLTAEEHALAGRALAPVGRRPLLACGPGTKMQAKDWGVEAWRALLDRLAVAFPKHGLVLVGAKDDHAVSEQVSAAWAGRSLNLCGALAPRVTAAVLAHTELFLGPDSGPMHFASAAGVPCAIAFASRTEPGIWYPNGPDHQVVYHRQSCSNCDLEVCTENKKRCLTSIEPDEMLEAAKRAWQKGQARRLASPGAQHEGLAQPML